MSLDPLFLGLQLKLANTWLPFEYKRAGPRAKAALFALKNFVATQAIRSYIYIMGMHFRVEILTENTAELVEVFFELQNGRQIPRDGVHFLFQWKSINMVPMRVRKLREPRTIGDMAREFDDPFDPDFGPNAGE